LFILLKALPSLGQETFQILYVYPAEVEVELEVEVEVKADVSGKWKCQSRWR
jgi:hypothetical protein